MQHFSTLLLALFLCAHAHALPAACCCAPFCTAFAACVRTAGAGSAFYICVLMLRCCAHTTTTRCAPLCVRFFTHMPTFGCIFCFVLSHCARSISRLTRFFLFLSSCCWLDGRNTSAHACLLLRAKLCARAHTASPPATSFSRTAFSHGMAAFARAFLRVLLWTRTHQDGRFSALSLLCRALPGILPACYTYYAAWRTQRLSLYCTHTCRAPLPLLCLPGSVGSIPDYPAVLSTWVGLVGFVLLFYRIQQYHLPHAGLLTICTLPLTTWISLLLLRSVSLYIRPIFHYLLRRHQQFYHRILHYPRRWF